MQGGIKNDDFRPIYRCISETVTEMGTCSGTICKHRILFPSIQHLAWLPQGRPQGKQKCDKNSNFGLTHWLKHRVTRKLLEIDRYMLRGFSKHWIVFSFMQRFAWLPQGRPQSKQKMKAGVRKNGDFFCIVLRITGKLLLEGIFLPNVRRYFLHTVWLNRGTACLWMLLILVHFRGSLHRIDFSSFLLVE